MTTTPTNHPRQSTRNPTRRALVRRGTALAGCLALAACLTLPTGTPRAAATPPPDTPTTQVLSGTAPAPTTGHTSPDTVRNPGATTRAATGTGTDTTSPGAATSATTTTSTDADAADAAREDAVVLARALDEGDYTALTQAVSERVAPRVGGDVYATALVDALGARGLVRVAAHLPTGGGTLPAGSSSGGAEGARGCRVGGADSTGAAGIGLACTWTSLLATATASPLWDEGHREALARNLASLVTTTGDLAEPDTLLLPVGFRRLLTADQDPLAGTQTSDSSDSEDVRDPLALEAGFLAALTRGVMAGETAGGLRVGWVEYARLTTTAGGGYANFPEGKPQDVTAHRASYDPLPAVLTAATRTPATVLDVLAPPQDDRDSQDQAGQHSSATKVDATTWEWVAARAQEAGPACLEALTAAVASASTLRYQANPYEARAAWLTEQAVVTLADVDTTTWTPTARRTTAVILANSIGDLWDAATDVAHNDLYASSDKLLPVSWQDRHDEELTTLLQNVLTDDTALTTISRAAEALADRHLAVTAGRIPSGTSIDEAYKQVLGTFMYDVTLYSYVYGARSRTEGTYAPEDRELLQVRIMRELRRKPILALATAGLLPDEAYPNIKGGSYGSDWMTQDENQHWHVDPHKAEENAGAVDDWMQTNKYLAGPLLLTDSTLITVAGYGLDKGIGATPPTTNSRTIARHAALVVALTTATALLVYSLSHTHQRRRNRRLPCREERRRRRRERHSRWYEEEYRGGHVN
ncbi:hypothetical protein [Actinomyces sp. oral taxon 897]|uniref:hypothetical protein n=1 Tax=Actinomyces sp. oral taxon 897 TaxID=2081702 RepID=UPI00101AD9B4|nr:hypothetical protein [Actinomyces sp. oral taxon 897]